MQQDYLAAHPDARIQVYAVWMNMLYGDSRAAWDRGILTDGRAQNFWDEQRFAGRYFANGHGIAYGAIYDYYCVFPPAARWGDKPQATGSEFADHTETLQKALEAAIAS